MIALGDAPLSVAEIGCRCGESGMLLNTLNLFGWRDGGSLDRLRRTRAHRIDLPIHRLGEDVGPRGLMVRDPYASQILNGEKVWEIRGRATQVRGPVVIVKSGTGHAFGIANLVRVLGPLDIDDLTDARELPLAEREEVARYGLPYPKTYAYVFSDPKWFENPIPYRHPSGAVTWVRLPDLDLGTARYASSSRGATQLRLV